MNAYYGNEAMPTETRVAQAVEEAFTVLGHETRLAILFALWEHRSHDVHVPQHSMTFAELRKAVGLPEARSSTTTSSHCSAGSSTRRTTATSSGARANASSVRPSLERSPTRSSSSRNRATSPVPSVAGTGSSSATPNARSGTSRSGVPSARGVGGVGFDGALSLTDPLLPVSTRSRDPREFYPALLVKVRHDMMSAVEGVYPVCTGTMSVTPYVCADHHVAPGRHWGSCDTIYEVRFVRECDVCHLPVGAPPHRYPLTEPRVLAFLDEHGYDAWDDWYPIELEVVLEENGDRLVASLDGDGEVVALHRAPSASV